MQLLSYIFYFIIMLWCSIIHVVYKVYNSYTIMYIIAALDRNLHIMDTVWLAECFHRKCVSVCDTVFNENRRNVNKSPMNFSNSQWTLSYIEWIIRNIYSQKYLIQLHRIILDWEQCNTWYIKRQLYSSISLY